MSVSYKEGDFIIVHNLPFIPEPIYGTFINYVMDRNGAITNFIIIKDSSDGQRSYYFTGYSRLATETEILLYF